MAFHEGELAVQAQAGVQSMARIIGRGIHAEMPVVFQDFVDQQNIAVAGSVDGDGQVWASLLTGKAGFIHSLDEQTVQITTKPVEGDPLINNLAANPAIGLIVIDFATRQRVRLNGTADINSSGILLRIQQAYANCQKYIQARDPEVAVREAQSVQSTQVLTDDQQRWIAQADTLFIASYHPGAGVDASHRGGNPGFVQVRDEKTIIFPDYSGNKMFNTLGNLAVNPHAGLLFLDFERGRTLQITGQARVIWDAELAAVFSGAERVVEVAIAQTIEISNAIPFRFDLMQYSSFNPRDSK